MRRNSRRRASVGGNALARRVTIAGAAISIGAVMVFQMDDAARSAVTPPSTREIAVYRASSFPRHPVRTSWSVLFKVPAGWRAHRLDLECVRHGEICPGPGLSIRNGVGPCNEIWASFQVANPQERDGTPWTDVPGDYQRVVGSGTFSVPLLAEDGNVVEALRTQWAWQRTPGIDTQLVLIYRTPSGGRAVSMTIGGPAPLCSVAKRRAYHRVALRLARRLEFRDGARVAITRATTCPSRSQTLAGVYHPERLKIVDHCRYASGRVIAVRDENDGDLHIEVTLNPRYKKLLSLGNFDSYYRLVVEFMARDAGHLPRPSPGDRIRMVGAWVHDAEHGNWSEFHPVWAVSLNGGRWRHSGPQFGGSPPQARSRNAEGLCRDEKGRECDGY